MLDARNREFCQEKNPTVWYLLWRVQERHPTRGAIKVGNQQAKATNANEMPLWNHFTVFRNYNKWDDFSLAAKIRYHKHYPAKTATQSLKKIQEPQQQLGHWGLKKISLIKILSAEISDLTMLDLVSSATSASIHWWRATRQVEWIETGRRFVFQGCRKGEENVQYHPYTGNEAVSETYRI